MLRAVEPGDREFLYRVYASTRTEELAVVPWHEADKDAFLLLPEHRGNGVGKGLVRDLLAEADAAGMRVTIHVERFNRALRLYERLGFAVAEDKGVYLLLERPPAYVNTAS